MTRCEELEGAEPAFENFSGMRRLTVQVVSEGFGGMGGESST